jgi:hypothetical protein
MEEIKRQLNSNSNNYVQSKRQKIQGKIETSFFSLYYFSCLFLATTNEIRG